MQQQPTGYRPHYRMLALLIILASVLSCTKTETIPFDRPSDNTILEYKVTNAADTIFGAIDNTKNTITVYIPYYLGIEYIVPAIRIASKATLLDAAGNVVNLDGGILPVPVDTTGYSYTVMGSDNVKRTYQLLLRIAPHPDVLKVGYLLKGSNVNYDTAIKRAINGRIPIYGNFGSTSTNARFTLTHKTSGKAFTNVLRAVDVTPGVNYYTMNVDINADADSGFYKVELTHQGRTTTLPDIHLIYQKPKFVNLKSTSVYAPGDTVVFAATGLTLYDAQNGVVSGLERVYMKFYKTGFNFGGSYPSTFPESLFGQVLEMKIVSKSRTTVKAIFPDLPTGAIGNYVYSFSLDFPGIGFYFDFASDTGWGKDQMLCTTGRLFTIAAKK
jgi:hypothetical protein